MASPSSTVNLLRWALSVYRNMLAQVAPDRCRQVDEIIARTGRAVTPTVHFERMDDHDVLTPRQASEVTNLSQRTLAEYRRRHKLEGVKVGRQWCFTVLALKKFLASRASATVEGRCRVIAGGESLSKGESA